MDSDLGEGGAASSSSVDSNSIRSYKYDVFISFRGPDTRNTFVDHLYAHLIRKGIFAFKDDTRLQKGEPISSQLLQAIKDSRASIVVFSKDYAASTWCLDEMAAIAQCHTELKQTVFPVFHDVDPSHVRKQNGVYKSAFDLHTLENPGKVDGWKRAMTTFANSAGWDVRNKKKADMEVEAIVLDHKEEHDFDEFDELIRAAKFHKMKHLKLLILYQKKFSGMPVFLSDSLCYFSWNGYPFTSFPRVQLRPLVELNMPNSNIEQLWTGLQRLPNLKRMDMSNSKNLKMTPRFDWVQNLERLDFTGCINLVEVHPSIGFLKSLQFLSLQNCSSLVSLSFDSGSATLLSSLRVLRLSGCKKLENTPDFTRASYIEYLDMDGCTSLSTIHESVGALKKLRSLSLRDCTNLVGIPDNFNDMTSLVTLDLCGCSNLKNLPMWRIISNDSSPLLQSLIFLDVSFCKISEVPEAVGELRGLERLNLQGNNFIQLPSTIKWLSRLAYLNVSHCHSLVHLSELPIESSSSESVGRYFKTTSGSRDHRSGLYAFDCHCVVRDSVMVHSEWVQRLVKEPCLFRCGFDIVLPYPRRWESWDSPILEWFDKNHRFDGGSIIRITHSNMHVDWVGFVFCVAFTVENRSAISGSPLPHPFYLSFESEHTEERFDMPLSLEHNRVDGSNYIWTIYISREHCHFVKTGARITFKACQGLIVKEWGLRVLTKRVNWISFERTHLPLVEVIDNGEESSGSIEGKIQLPYNWFISDEDKDENDDAKRKETDLYNRGLLTGQ